MTYYIVIDKDTNKERRFERNGNAVNYFTTLKNAILIERKNKVDTELMRHENGMLVF